MHSRQKQEAEYQDRHNGLRKSTFCTSCKKTELENIRYVITVSLLRLSNNNENKFANTEKITRFQYKNNDLP